MADQLNDSVVPPPASPPPPLPISSVPPARQEDVAANQGVVVTSNKNSNDNTDDGLLMVNNSISPNDTNDGNNNNEMIKFDDDTNDIVDNEQATNSVRRVLRSACTTLESARCYETELEAWTLFSSSQLKYYFEKNQKKSNTNTKQSMNIVVPLEATTTTTSSDDNNNYGQHHNALPVGVADAWRSLADSIPKNDDESIAPSSTTAISSNDSGVVTIPINGSVSKAIMTNCIARSMEQMSNRASLIINERMTKGQQQLKRSHDELQSLKTNTTTPNANYTTTWLQLLDERLREIREYHAQHEIQEHAILHQRHVTNNNNISMMMSNNKKQKLLLLGNPIADGYDIASTVHQWTDDIILNRQQQQQQPKSLTTSTSTTPQPDNQAGRAGSVENNGTTNTTSYASTTFSRGTYRTEELFGKYIDLQPNYEYFIHNCAAILSSSSTTGGERTNDATSNSNRKDYQYIDFLEDMSKNHSMIHQWTEPSKLQYRKTYVRFLMDLQMYLMDYIHRTVPLLNINATIIDPAILEFESIWSKTGGYPPSWTCKPNEASLIVVAERKTDTGDMLTTKNGGTTSMNNTTIESSSSVTATTVGMDLSKYDTVQEMVDTLDGECMKIELAKLGLKCGGTPHQRAERLFLLKSKSLHELPAKLFADKSKIPRPKPETNNSLETTSKAKNNDTLTTSAPEATGSIATGSSGTVSTKKESRVDIARRESIINALLDQVRPTIEGTIRRMVRRQTQTLAEREREVDEDLYGVGAAKTSNDYKKKKSNDGNDDVDGDDDDDDDDAPIYNPKNVPLDFDGRPIPYWLFKLHGLNHYYTCEICNGEVYRGRRAFELHFAEQKHSIGMKILNIPNTKHFHGITKVQDAQTLWKQLQIKLQNESFDVSKEEEYEDSHGNVLSRTAYEDLARQGLL